MIFYFTGTGNSLYVAKQLDAERYSIPQVIHQKKRAFFADQIGIVCPVYGHEMPAMVKEFLAKSSFDTPYFFIVLTYGANHGGAAELAEEYLSSIGKTADYITSVEMVDNFLPAFDMEEQMAEDKKVEEQVESVRQDILKRRKSIQRASEKDKDVHKTYVQWVKNAPETIWANYIITEECVGCGICTRVCPAGCIRLENQRAVNTGVNCQACYACIQACPKLAIRFGDILMKERNPQARYRNPNIALTELVDANDQTNAQEIIE